MIDWQPVAELDKSSLTWLDFVLLCSVDHRWIRMGRWYAPTGRWYYSATAERSQFAQNDGDDPTHWARMNFPHEPDQG